MWQQILFELRVDCPLRLNLRAVAADQDAKQLDVQ